MKPEFLKVLHSIKGVNPEQRVFQYTELTELLSKYILSKKDLLFDGRNIRVAVVENDDLGKAFGVKAFARCQVPSLLRAQLTPWVDDRLSDIEKRLMDIMF